MPVGYPGNSLQLDMPRTGAGKPCRASQCLRTGLPRTSPTTSCSSSASTISAGCSLRPRTWLARWDSWSREGKADVNILVGNVVERLFIEGRLDLVVNTRAYNSLLQPVMGERWRAESRLAYVGWNRILNARQYEIRSRIQGMTEWWSDTKVSTFASYFAWVLDGQTWGYQVRTVGKPGEVSEWTPVASTVAHPQTARGPSPISVVPSNGGIQVSWPAVTGYSLNRYVVITWDQDTLVAFIQGTAVSGTSVFVPPDFTLHRYSIWVATWVNLPGGPAGGLPAPGRSVVPGWGRPGPPTNLAVVNIDPITVKLTWTGADYAAGYAIYATAVGGTEPLQLKGTSELLFAEIPWMLPGTWHYQFCVTAYNGNLESPPTAVCITPPVYPGYSRRDVVEGDAPGNTLVLTNTTMNGYDTDSMISDTALQALYHLLRQNETATLTHDLNPSALLA